jgi:polysaccharide pyruvyl transferase WcaK-like protein
MKTPNSIVLITKTATQNQGNQALSVAWLRFLQETFPDAEVVALERMPRYLKRFRTATLAASSDPVAMFEGWAQSLAELKPDLEAPSPATTRIVHRPEITQARRFMKLRRMLAIRSRLAAFGAGKSDYRARLAVLSAADVVVINPAGEFQGDATDTALAYLLELRLGQLTGARTGMVNLSFEVESPTIRTISVHVMNQAELVEFRDEPSKVEFESVGGASSIVLPDMAVMTPVEHVATRDGHAIGMAINGLQARAAGLEAEWARLLDRLRDVGHEPILVSNEWSTDAPLWPAVQGSTPVQSEGRDVDYAAYASLLGGFDIVLSSRLHTCVLALCAGTYVIPVETGTFKLSGFFEQIGLPDAAISLSDPTWNDQVADRIAAYTADPSLLGPQLAARDAARETLAGTLRPRLIEMLGAGS